jgi:hypothetical protein
LLALATLAIVSCGGDEVVGPRPPVNISFVTILEGGYWGCADCDSTVAAVFLIENQESWRDSVRREQDRIVVRATRRMGCSDCLLPTPPFRAFHIVRVYRRVAPVDLSLRYEGCP